MADRRWIAAWAAVLVVALHCTVTLGQQTALQEACIVWTAPGGAKTYRCFQCPRQLLDPSHTCTPSDVSAGRHRVTLESSPFASSEQVESVPGPSLDIVVDAAAAAKAADTSSVGDDKSSSPLPAVPPVTIPPELGFTTEPGAAARLLLSGMRDRLAAARLMCVLGDTSRVSAIATAWLTDTAHPESTLMAMEVETTPSRVLGDLKTQFGDRVLLVRGATSAQTAVHAVLDAVGSSSPPCDVLVFAATVESPTESLLESRPLLGNHRPHLVLMPTRESAQWRKAWEQLAEQGHGGSVSCGHVHAEATERLAEEVFGMACGQMWSGAEYRASTTMDGTLVSSRLVPPVVPMPFTEPHVVCIARLANQSALIRAPLPHVTHLASIDAVIRRTCSRLTAADATLRSSLPTCMQQVQGMLITSAKMEATLPPPDVTPSLMSYYDSVKALENFVLSMGHIITEGHTATYPHKLELMQSILMDAPQGARVCEIGFNGGHSALLWLSRPDVSVVSFDLGRHPYTRLAAEFLETRYPGRLRLIFGDSGATVPWLATTDADVLQGCHILFVDGAHDAPSALADLRNMASLAPVGQPHTLLVDDTRCPNGWCTGPTEAWEQAKQDGLLEEVSHSIQAREDVFMVLGHYLRTPPLPDWRTVVPAPL